MLKIFLCDDERDSRSLLMEYSKQLLAENTLPAAELRAFASAEELLSCEEEPDILLLDVQLGNINGLDAARQLRARGCLAFIILVTNYVQYAIDGYEVQAFHFLKKPVAYDHFSQVLSRALKMADRRKHASVTIRAGDQLIHIPTRTILYCETDKNAVLIHTDKECIRCVSSMAALEKELSGQDFYRCHTAFLVNLAAVERSLATSVLLQDKTELPVSKHRKKDFREKLAAYWGDSFL